MLASRYIADYFVASARRNNHTWDDALTADYSVYSYAPHAQGDPMWGYQGYIFTF